MGNCYSDFGLYKGPTPNKDSIELQFGKLNPIWVINPYRELYFTLTPPYMAYDSVQLI